MKVSNNSVMILIFSFVAVVTIVVMLVSSSVNRNGFNSVGFAVSPLYSGYAVPIAGIVIDNNLNFLFKVLNTKYIFLLITKS